MAADDLHDPLGLDGPATRPSGPGFPFGKIALGGLCALALGLVVFSLATDTGLGGRPFAEAVIAPPRPQEPPSTPVTIVAAPPPGLQTSQVAQSGATLVDVASGVRMARQGGAGNGPLIIKVPQEPVGLQLVPAPDPRLVEKGRHGPLPRIGAEGSRPSEIYARPLVSAPNIKAGAPRIAIVVGGMGLNPAATTDAVESLPEAVTLGFAPYGADLDRQVALARQAGHEVVLQAPMEPLDKSAIPGPYTLLSGVEAGQNIESLRWVLSRLTGYVGVANFLGGRFMAREADLAPVLREIAARGLLFLDDGSATQSIAPGLAAAAGMQAARADVVLDANARADAIEAALGRLEAIARTRGFAIGYAAGLPGALEPVTRFAQGLEKRGVALVPLSALAVRGTASAALAR